MDLKFLESVTKHGDFSRASFLLLMYMYLIKTWTGLQSDLGDILKLDRRTINISLRILEENGYLKRIPTKEDKRIKTIKFIA